MLVSIQSQRVSQNESESVNIKNIYNGFHSGSES